MSWGIVHNPEDIIVHEGDGGPWTMSCPVVEDCTEPLNPWFDQADKQVNNDTKKGIKVTHKLVPGTNTVVEWNITFTKLPHTEIPVGTYTCKVPDATASATLKRAGE